MQLIILWVGLLLGVFYSDLGYSTVVQGLYEAQVPLQQDTPEQRNVAQRMAFAQVLMKLTGISGFAQQNQYADLLDQAPRYVQQFQVKQGAAGVAALSVHFDPNAVQELVRTRGLPIWAQDRPNSLLLVAIEQGTSRSLLGNENDPGLRGVVMRAAHQRAIPVILPLLDIEDQRNINLSDLWGGFFERLVTVRDRYGASNLLIGRALHERGSWSIRWTLKFASGASEDWSTSAVDFHDAIAQGVDGLADQLAHRYAVIQGIDDRAGRLYLAVEHVRSLKDYARVTQYLEKLSPVKNLRVEQISANEVVFQLGLLGEMDGLRRAIEMEPLLLPVLSYRDDLSRSPLDPLQQPRSEVMDSALRYRLAP